MVTKAKRARLPATLPAGEFKAKCLQLMDQVAATGQSVVITKRGKPVAKLAPVGDRRVPLLGCCKDQIVYVGDVMSPIDWKWDCFE